MAQVPSAAAAIPARARARGRLLAGLGRFAAGRAP